MLLRELYNTINLCEAYDTKIAKLHKEFDQLRAGFPEKPETQWGPAEPAIPGNETVPDESQLAALVQFAEQAFKSGATPSEQAMQWYLLLLETYYKQNDPKFAGKFAAMIGQYQFTDFNSLNTDLAHFFISEYANSQYIKDIVKAIRPATTQVDNLITNATAAEQRIHTEEEAARKLSGRPDIELKHGDQVILPMDNKYDWWWLPYNSHEFEAAAMGHCGKCQTSSGNMLSFRTKHPIWPELTFEWNAENNVLYQTKGPKNSKPAHKYRPYILALMLSDLVSGLGDDSFQPANDFSIFDFEPADVKTIASVKPKLINDQIVKYPIDFLRAPDFIRATPAFRALAIRHSTGLDALVDATGKVNTSLDAWETAIRYDHDIIIYAPEELENYEERIIDALTSYLGNMTLLGFTSPRIRSNINIMTPVITRRPESIDLVPLRAPAYSDLALIAVTHKSELLKEIPEEKRTFEMCHIAITNRSAWANDSLSDFYRLFNRLPFSIEQHRELAVMLLRNDARGELIDLLPDEIKSYVTVMAQIAAAENNMWGDDRRAKMTEIFNSIDTNTLTSDELNKVCVTIGKLTYHNAIPLELQTYNYFNQFILTVEPTKNVMASSFHQPAFNQLPGEQQLHLFSTMIKLCPEAYFEVPSKFRYLNIDTLLDVLDTTQMTLNENIAMDIRGCAMHRDLTNKQYHRLIDYYRDAITQSDGSILRYVTDRALSSANIYNQDDWLELLAYGATLNIAEFVVCLTTDFVDNNFEWVVTTIVNAVNGSKFNTYFSILTDEYPEVAIEIFNQVSASALSKKFYPEQLYQMYEVDPGKFKRVIGLMVDYEPDTIAQICQMTPEYIPADEQPWLDQLYYKGVTKGGISAIYSFPNDLLTPKLLSAAVLSTTSPSDDQTWRLIDLYKYFKDDPAYEAPLEQVIELLPLIVKLLPPNKITQLQVERYVRYLEKTIPLHNIRSHLKTEPFRSAAAGNSEIADYINKYDAENAD